MAVTLDLPMITLMSANDRLSISLVKSMKPIRYVGYEFPNGNAHAKYCSCKPEKANFLCLAQNGAHSRE
eukprot:4168465-Pleurochrysis_carterae.AAC.2